MAGCKIGKKVSDVMTVNFEVFGKVQGVFFRKHTRKQASELGLRGWVMNTGRCTVVGTIQGSADQITRMKTWLKTTGSPRSRIDKCDFKDVEPQKAQEFKSFEIRK